MQAGGDCGTGVFRRTFRNNRQCYNATIPLFHLLQKDPTMRVRAILVVWAVLAAPGLASFVSADEPVVLRSVEGISEYRLDNGLQVLLFPDSSSPKVTVNLTIFAGSRHEGYGEAGMAHLLEHMVFKGTPTFPQIPAELKKRGADFNGTTWLDRTNYYETLPAGDENLEFALQMEADRMVNSLIRAEDLASEMTVVRNEFESGENSPQNVLMERVMAAAFEWHNYGQSTIGNQADIMRVPVDRLRKFYERFYQPDNAMLVVAGRFDSKQAMSLILKYFGALPKPARELDRTYTEEPAQDGERMVTVRRVGDVPAAALLYHIPAGAHPDYAAVDVLATVMASEPAGRLYEGLVRRRLAASCYGFSFALHDPGALLFGADAAEGTDGSTLLQSLVESVETASEKEFTAEETDRAKAELLKSRELQMANSQQVAIELSEWAAQGDWRLFFLHRDRLESVTAADVSRVAKKYLVRTNRTAGVFEPTKAPERAEIPATPNLAELLQDYRGRAAVAQGEEFDASPQAIEAKLQRAKLESGIRVTLLPKKTRGSMATLQLTLRYGNLQALENLGLAAELLPELLMRGTANRSRQDIADELNTYRARMSLSGAPGTLTARIQVSRENLPPVLNLLRDVLRNPAFPADEMELLREEQLAAIGQQVSDPVALAFSAATRRISPYGPADPRHEASLPEQLERLKAVQLEQVKLVWSSLLAGSTGELTVLGDFDATAVTAAVQELTAGWTSKAAFARLPRVHVDNTEGSVEFIRTPDKANAAWIGMMTLPVRDDDPDFAALEIGNFILGSGGLSSRLGDRVRQNEGLSYGIQSGLQPSAVDRRTAFFIFAISNPQNVRKVDAAIREELARLLKDGITEDELAAAKSGYLQEQQVQRSSETALAATLEVYSFVGRDMLFAARADEQIRQLTVDQVNAALRKHLQPQRLYVVMAGDLENDGAAKTDGQ